MRVIMGAHYCSLGGSRAGGQRTRAGDFLLFSPFFLLFYRSLQFQRRAIVGSVTLGEPASASRFVTYVVSRLVLAGGTGEGDAAAAAARVMFPPARANATGGACRGWEGRGWRGEGR